MNAKTVFTFAGGVVTGLILGVWLFSGPSSQVAPVQPGPAPAPTSQPQVDVVRLQREIASLEDLLENDPGNYQAWKKLGDNLFDVGEHQRSIDAYRKALAIDDSDPNVWTDMGIMERRSGDPKAAIEAFNEGAKRSPTHAMSRLNLGVVYIFDLKDFEKGAQAWEEFLRMEPTGARADDIRRQLADVRQMIAVQKGEVPTTPEGGTGSGTGPSSSAPGPKQ